MTKRTVRHEKKITLIGKKVMARRTMRQQKKIMLIGKKVMARWTVTQPTTKEKRAKKTV